MEGAVGDRIGKGLNPEFEQVSQVVGPGVEEQPPLGVRPGHGRLGSGGKCRLEPERPVGEAGERIGA
jgi:hypothetical protein